MFPRLLTLLQFTRIALVFTAIADGWTSMLLQARATGTTVSLPYAAAMTVASAALYTFGMALNDLIDRRRDSQIAPGRPLPSGRLRVSSAQLIVGLLALIAIAAGGAVSMLGPDHTKSILLLGLTLALITFYDFTGKYLVALGLLSLGLVRFCHATIAAPTLAFPWHALTLLAHVTILSTVCYALEAKRPRLTLKHWLLVFGGLAAIVAIVLSLLVQQRVADQPLRWEFVLWFRKQLWFPAGAAAGFVILASVIYATSRDGRAAGRSIMLYGLLWLIVYDAAFVYGFDTWPHALMVLGLLPMAYLAVQAMRAWSRLVDLSHTPQFQRAR